MAKTSSQEGYIPVNGGRVWYRIAGGGSGIPLLTLHGGPGVTCDYLYTMDALADERPVIYYDQLGSGKSDRPENDSLWVLTRFVQELGQVRAALGLAQVHLLGQSWGTILATAYALEQPQGLASLILYGPALSVPRYVQDANALKQALPAEMRAAMERHEADGTTDAPEYEVIKREWSRRHVCRNEPLWDAMRKIWADPVTGRNNRIYNVMWGPSEFTSTGNLQDWDATPKLGEIRVPTLFLCGRDDECTPGATAWYASLVPGSEMVVFEHSAHAANLEEPELFNQTMRDWLRRSESTPVSQYKD